MRIAPSLLAADLADLTREVARCAEGGADLLHVDVMDGRFVPNLTFGIPVIAALKRHTEIPLDVHLMVEEPGRLLDDYLSAGSDRVAVHWEATVHLDRVLGRIREAGAAAGVAVNPATPVELLGDVLGRLDFVLLMSVNPGFAGQPFLPHVLAKARRLRELAASARARVEIALDGGVDAGNVRQAAEAGVHTCVAGSSIFGAADPAAEIGRLRELATGAAV
ncbi:MAG: ribulose-phosphate 3-epimerase [Thermoanaerobaculia bacterium]|nr:ribulose-phosphate 3-epimerase [Thermoanaerobaculia bacterium]